MTTRCAALVHRFGKEPRPCKCYAMDGSAFCVYHQAPENRGRVYKISDRYANDVTIRTQEVNGPAMYELLKRIAAGRAGPTEAAEMVALVDKII